MRVTVISRYFWSLAGGLSLPCTRSMVDWRPLTVVDKLSIMGQPSGPTQPSILSGSASE